MDEKSLVDRLEADDPEAVRQLYRRYRPKVMSVARANVDSERDAQEVTQDVLWKVYRKIEMFRGDSALWTWMYRIAVNEARMKTRKTRRRPRPVDEETLAGLLEDLEGEYRRRPDHLVALRDILETARDYLESSKPTNRTIFVALEFEGRCRRALADRFDLSVSAVKARLHRMRVGLRKHIRQEYLHD